MGHALKFTLHVTFCAFALLWAGCRQNANQQDANKPGSGTGRTILDKKKKIPPRMELNAFVTSKNGETFSFRIASQGPFAINVVKDATYQAIQNKNNKAINKADVLLIADSKEPIYEGKVTIPPGTSWFIIENQTDKEVEMHLQISAP